MISHIVIGRYCINRARVRGINLYAGNGVEVVMKDRKILFVRLNGQDIVESIEER